MPTDNGSAPDSSSTRIVRNHLVTIGEVAFAGLVSAATFTILEDFPLYVRIILALMGIVGFLCLHFAPQTERHRRKLYAAASFAALLVLIFFAIAIYTSGKPPSPMLSQNPSAPKGMPNAELRETTIAHVEQLRDLIARCDKLEKEHQAAHRSIVPVLQFEVATYEQKFASKSRLLRHQLLERLPFYLEEMDPEKRQMLQIAYDDPFQPQMIKMIADDLDDMAHRLQSQSKRQQ